MAPLPPTDHTSSCSPQSHRVGGTSDHVEIEGLRVVHWKKFAHDRPHAATADGQLDSWFDHDAKQAFLDRADTRMNPCGC
jgi:hypothetical protein